MKKKLYLLCAIFVSLVLGKTFLGADTAATSGAKYSNVDGESNHPQWITASDYVSRENNQTTDTYVSSDKRNIIKNAAKQKMAGYIYDARNGHASVNDRLTANQKRMDEIMEELRSLDYTKTESGLGQNPMSEADMKTLQRLMQEYEKLRNENEDLQTLATEELMLLYTEREYRF